MSRCSSIGAYMSSNDIWREVLLVEGSSIKDAVKVLNIAALKIVLVVDRDGVLVGTISSRPHIIGAPVYIIHCESNVSEHGSGSGHPTEVGHGAGLGMKVSSHPHFLHVFFVVAIFYKLINMELVLVLKDHMDLYKSLVLTIEL